MAEQAPPITPTVLQTWHQGNIASVANNAVNTFEVRTGNNVHGLNIAFKAVGGITPLTRAQMITDVVGFRAWINGELIYDRTTTQILDRYLTLWNKYGALAAPLGVLPIRFTNARMPVFDQRRGFAIGMLKSGGRPGAGPYNVLTCEVTMGAAVATAVVGEIHVVSDQYAQEPTGLHMRQLRTTRDLLGAGIPNVINDLPRSAYALSNVSIVTAQVFERASVLYDSSYLYRDLDSASLAIMQDEAGLTPQTGYIDLPFDLGEDLHSSFPFYGLSSFELQVQTSVAPGAGTAILTDEVWDKVRE
jgi:hypothetical protein